VTVTWFEEVEMRKSSTGGQIGGVNIHGGTVSTQGGDIIGRDKIVGRDGSREVEEALRPLTDLLTSTPSEHRAAALSKLEELKREASKGEKRDDGLMAKLVEGLVGLVPSAAGAVATAFGTPILGAIAGPVTKYVIDKIQGGQ
jgi:hypothetical protein